MRLFAPTESNLSLWLALSVSFAIAMIGGLGFWHLANRSVPGPKPAPGPRLPIGQKAQAAAPQDIDPKRAQVVQAQAEKIERLESLLVNAQGDLKDAERRWYKLHELGEKVERETRVLIGLQREMDLTGPFLDLSKWRELTKKIEDQTDLVKRRQKDLDSYAANYMEVGPVELFQKQILETKENLKKARETLRDLQLDLIAK